MVLYTAYSFPVVKDKWVQLGNLWERSDIYQNRNVHGPGCQVRKQVVAYEWECLHLERAVYPIKGRSRWHGIRSWTALTTRGDQRPLYRLWRHQL